MTVLSGTDESGAPALYDIPDAELSKYKLNLKPMTDEVRNRLFPGKKTLTREDADGVAAAPWRAEREVEAYTAMCLYWCYCEDADCDIWYYEAPC